MNNENQRIFTLLNFKYFNKMKIQLDTVSKTIKVEESVNFGEFVKEIKKILPNGEWKEYGLLTQSTINWNPYPYIHYPWATTTEITTNSLNVQHTELNEGVFNIDTSISN